MSGCRYLGSNPTGAERERGRERESLNRFAYQIANIKPAFEGIACNKNKVLFIQRVVFLLLSISGVSTPMYFYPVPLLGTVFIQKMKMQSIYRLLCRY